MSKFNKCPACGSIAQIQQKDGWNVSDCPACGAEVLLERVGPAPAKRASPLVLVFAAAGVFGLATMTLLAVVGYWLLATPGPDSPAADPAAVVASNTPPAPEESQPSTAADPLPTADPLPAAESDTDGTDDVVRVNATPPVEPTQEEPSTPLANTPEADTPTDNTPTDNTPTASVPAGSSPSSEAAPSGSQVIEGVPQLLQIPQRTLPAEPVVPYVAEAGETPQGKEQFPAAYSNFGLGGLTFVPGVAVQEESRRSGRDFYREIQLSRLATGEEMLRFRPPHPGAFLGMSPSAKYVLYHDMEDVARLNVYSLETRELVAAWRPHRRLATAVMIDDEHVLTLGKENTFVLWRLPDCKPVYRLFVPSSEVTLGATIDLSPQRGYFAVLSRDRRSIQVVHTRTGELAAVLPFEHPQFLGMVAASFRSDGRFLLSISRTREKTEIIVWDISEGTVVRQLPIEPATYFVQWIGMRRLLLRNTNDWKPIEAAPRVPDPVPAEPGFFTLRLVEVSDGSRVHDFQIQSGKGSVAATSPDGRLWTMLAKLDEAPGANKAAATTVVKAWDLADFTAPPPPPAPAEKPQFPAGAPVRLVFQLQPQPLSETDKIVFVHFAKIFIKDITETFAQAGHAEDPDAEFEARVKLVEKAGEVGARDTVSGGITITNRQGDVLFESTYAQKDSDSINDRLKWTTAYIHLGRIEPPRENYPPKEGPPPEPTNLLQP
ncbi:WD40 repeat domain-containing protein [Lignipirellula cremea]|uniref:WD domain, G-beta repeat n=1 Tax=Lignipirellula cremea TaxID=2528010 RepID=A0A518E0M5_9BACT|nr:hypothetical protein [Lignipirellula cremea]QDU97633.1 hypothetical protein Pla8534_54830 [Lignipirellula cremea]